MRHRVPVFSFYPWLWLLLLLFGAWAKRPTVPGQHTIKNIHVLGLPIPSEYLEKPFDGAANIVLELGLSFIWIDSLCIIWGISKD